MGMKLHCEKKNYWYKRLHLLNPLYQSLNKNIKFSQKQTHKISLSHRCRLYHKSQRSLLLSHANPKTARPKQLFKEKPKMSPAQSLLPCIPWLPCGYNVMMSCGSTRLSWSTSVKVGVSPLVAYKKPRCQQQSPP